MNKGNVVLNTVTTRPANDVSDPFGRTRTSSTYSLFDSQFLYDKGEQYWNEQTLGTSASTYLPFENTVEFSVGTANGDKVVRQSKKYVPYFPGKSQFITLGSILGAPVTNQVKRLGYFDERNGVFFELTEDGLYVVIRNYATGTAVDTRIPQSAWSLDTMDGTGPSQVTIDPTKTLIFVMDLQWLGVGQVRWGFALGGIPTYVHEFKGANVSSLVDLGTGNLPVRYEVCNIGPSAGSSDFKQIGSSVATESGTGGGGEGRFPQQLGTAFTDPTTGIVLGATEIPVISFRPKQTFKGKRVTAPIVPTDLDIVLTGEGSARWVLYFDPVINDTTWISASPESVVEYNLDATTITLGTPIASGFVSVGAAKKGGFFHRSIQSSLVASRSIDGTEADLFTLALVGLSLDVPNAYAQLSWLEAR